MGKAEVEGMPVERVARAIVLVRGQRVLLDRDLAVLYGVVIYGTLARRAT